MGLSGCFVVAVLAEVSFVGLLIPPVGPSDSVAALEALVDTSLVFQKLPAELCVVSPHSLASPFLASWPEYSG